MNVKAISYFGEMNFIQLSYTQNKSLQCLIILHYRFPTINFFQGAPIEVAVKYALGVVTQNIRSVSN